MWRCALPAVAAAGALVLAGCGGSGAQPQTTSILADPVQQATFPQIRRAVDALYAAHPDIGSFVVRNVEYTPATRDKVLRICREGALSKTAQQREATRVYACAPLIFFFDRYGRERKVPAAVELAQRLYWYGSRIGGPFDANAALKDILGRWHVR